MNARAFRPLVFLLLIASAGKALAQAPPPPPAPPPGAAAARDNAGPQTGTGRIRGRVVDAETGTALRDALLRLSASNLRESPVSGTDENGRFEFENLPAGRYSLATNKPGYMALSYGQRRPFESGRPIDLANNQTLENIDFAVPRGGVIVAHVTDENGEALAGMRIQAQRYRFLNGQRALLPFTTAPSSTDDRGEVRVYGLPPGEYYVSTAIGPPWAAANGTSYVTTYYPGTAAADAAQPVAVQVGKEVHVNIQLVAAKLVRVSGVVRRADGSPGARLQVLASTRTPGLIVTRGGPAQPDGSFTINDVPPGEYSLTASSNSPQPEDREQGTALVSVSSSNVSNVVIAMARGGTIRGRVVFEPGTPTGLQLGTLRPMTSPGGVTLTGPPTVQDDGTFAIGGVMGPGLIRLYAPPAGWYLKSVLLNGKDVTDTPIGLDGRPELAGVDIVLTQKRGELAGTAIDGRGAAASDYAVVLFAEDRAQWTFEGRFIATVRPDQQGRFRIQGMPPGKYLAAAVEYIESGTERDPEVLGRLQERATPVTLVEGEARSVTLSVQ